MASFVSSAVKSLLDRSKAGRQPAELVTGEVEPDTRPREQSIAPPRSTTRMAMENLTRTRWLGQQPTVNSERRTSRAELVVVPALDTERDLPALAMDPLPTLDMVPPHLILATERRNLDMEHHHRNLVTEGEEDTGVEDTERPNLTLDTATVVKLCGGRNRAAEARRRVREAEAVLAVLAGAAVGNLRWIYTNKKLSIFEN